MGHDPELARLALCSLARRARPVARKGPYEPTGSTFHAAQGSLEDFLTERYCLYNLNHARTPYRLDIHHPPWALQPAKAVFSQNTMATSADIGPTDGAPLLHFVKRQDMVAWRPASLGD
jgi:uncharacterized protein YqjF (DUF2071 family)